MSLLTIILASLAALEHLYIFYLESIRTTSDTTSRVFNMNKEELVRPSVTSLFKNQGIYNALIGVFLLYGLFAVSYTHLDVYKRQKEDKAAVEQAPSILDYLDEESQAHFDAVRRMLEDLGVAYVIDTNMAVSYTHLDVYKRQVPCFARRE